jgi:predicted secreted protein
MMHTTSRLLTACLIICALGPAKGQTSEKKLSLSAGAEQTVSMTLNENIVIELTSNPSTGYRWDSDQRTRERRCYALQELQPEHNRAEASAPVLVGAPTTQQWSLRLDPDFLCIKEQLLSWTYHRPWESVDHQDPTAKLRLQTNYP